MPSSIKIEQNVVVNPECDIAVQTALSGSTVYSLPRWTAKRNIMDLMLMIMDEDGPLPMMNMKPTKKIRNAADQFYETHHREYEAMGQAPYGHIERVHNHNNACPKMYDELNKRRSIERVGITGLACQARMMRTPEHSSSENMDPKSDLTCPRCIRRKRRIEEERNRRRRLCRRCREQRRSLRGSKNKLSRIAKHKTSRPRQRQQRNRCRSLSLNSKPCIISSNKGFQCHLEAPTKSVSTCKSFDNLTYVLSQEITSPKIEDIMNQEKIDPNSKSSYKKRVEKKSESVKSVDQPDSITRPSVSSYNSFKSTEHEPMIE